MIAVSSPARVERLAKILDDQSVDAFIGWAPVTMGYLANFAEGAGERFMALGVHRSGKHALICPALSASQASRAGIGDVRPWKDGENPLALFKGLSDEWGLKSAIIGVDDELPAHMLLAMQEALPAALFKPGSHLVATLTKRKDEHELAAMRTAGRIADEALPAALAAIKPGVTELELADVLSNEMLKRGGKPSFCIVATGVNGAEPHHLSDNTKIARGDIVVMDYGCTVDGYQSDITRMAACGEASDEAKRVYDIVLRAHMAARAAIRPGVSGEAVDRAARSVIEAEGFGEFFMHRTGHGIGMRVHEEPNIVVGNTTGLEPGNCFSIEPGIYLQGKFGVRIENIVVCTETGHESLNAEPSPTLMVV